MWASLAAHVVKNLPALQETRVPSLGGEDSLEEGMATHSSVLAWRTPCSEEPGEAVHGVVHWDDPEGREGTGREVGGGPGMGNTCKSMADSCQCMAKTHYNIVK